MATIRLLLAFLCFAFIGGNQLHRIDRLNGCAKATEGQQRDALIKIAAGEVGVREATNNNDGVRVEAYLGTVGLKKPEPYCAAFISWVFARAGYQKPRSGWSPDMFPASRITRTASAADLLGIYFSGLKRIGHVGLIVKQKGSWIYSIEANTNVEGSREGSGVYRKIRHIKTIRSLADWVTSPISGRRKD